MFSWGQCCISTSQSLLLVWVFHFEGSSLPNFVAYSFFALQLGSFSVFPSCFPLSVTFFANNYNSFMKCTAQKMTFSIKGFFSKYDQIRSFLSILSHLLKKSLMKNFIFCAVIIQLLLSF